MKILYSLLTKSQVLLGLLISCTCLLSAQDQRTFTYKTFENWQYSISNNLNLESIPNSIWAKAQPSVKGFTTVITHNNNGSTSYRTEKTYESGFKDAWIPDYKIIETNDLGTKIWNSEGEIIYDQTRIPELDSQIIINLDDWNNIGSVQSLIPPSAEELTYMNSNGQVAYILSNGSLIILSNNSETLIDYVNQSILHYEKRNDTIVSSYKEEYLTSTTGKSYLKKSTRHRYELISSGWLRSTFTTTYYDLALNGQNISLLNEQNNENVSNNLQANSSRFSASEVLNNYSAKVYPNPVDDILSIEIPILSIDDKARIEIFDAYGRSVIHETLSLSPLNKISLSNLPAGTYYIKLVYASGILSLNKSFIKN